MIKSMTGFGRGELSCNGREYVVEIKTVNHRYLDVSIRLPRQFAFFEDFARKVVSKAISRGKVDINIQVNSFGNKEKCVSFDEELLKIYLDEANALEKSFNIKNDLTFSKVFELPEVIKISGNENEEELLNEFGEVLNVALDNLKKMRQEEGEHLAKDITKKCEVLSDIFENVENRGKDVVREYREKLSERIKEVLQDKSVVDENRLAMEVAVFADKSSIDEEIVRFKSHIKQLLKTLELEEPIGKKLDFIVQEMNREVNTIGSKANNLDITDSVIELKNEIEKIREQIQNIE